VRDDQLLRRGTGRVDLLVLRLDDRELDPELRQDGAALRRSRRERERRQQLDQTSSSSVK
jgi:hypothetical protein